MSVETIAVIIAAIITAVATIVAARLKDIEDLLHKPSRQIAGDWDGESYLLDRGVVDDSEYEQKRPPDLKYVATLRQTGSKVTGTMSMTEAQSGIGLYKHGYKGRVTGNYFIYELLSVEPEVFRLSTALLHAHNSGKMMRGYFVANTSDRDPRRTTVGYTIMHKRS